MNDDYKNGLLGSRYIVPPELARVLKEREREKMNSASPSFSIH